jgi:hypothetical protein
MTARTLTRTVDPDTITADSVTRTLDTTLDVVGIAGAMAWNRVAVLCGTVGRMDAYAGITVVAAAAVQGGGREEGEL